MLRSAGSRPTDAQPRLLVETIEDISWNIVVHQAAGHARGFAEEVHETDNVVYVGRQASVCLLAIGIRVHHTVPGKLPKITEKLCGVGRVELLQDRDDSINQWCSIYENLNK
eukprot:INCI14145.2.p2 GENE.INCI14145.2~~INCI14145.2.p2  ORF type:complete len:112 (-),score=4.52 INCI14145.2:55-390(-)